MTKNRRKNQLKECQGVNTFQAGDHKATRNRQDSVIDKILTAPREAMRETYSKLNDFICIHRLSS